MKTLEELYNEVMASDELKKEFCSLKPEEVEGFAEKHGCKATFDEIKTFLTEKSSSFGELSDEEIEQVSGGKTAKFIEVFASIGTVGLVCAATAAVSAACTRCGTAIQGEGFLCSPN